MKSCYFALLLLASLSLSAQDTRPYLQCGPTLNGAPGGAGNFGQTLAISGNGDVVAVGAPLGGANNSGIVRLFRRDGESYLPLGEPITTGAPNALFGRAIALNEAGTRLAFGTSERALGGGNAQLGFIVNTYDITATGYTFLASIVGAPGSGQFGATLDLSDDGTRLIVGDPDGGEFGRAHVYDYEAGNNFWQEIDQLTETTNSTDFGNAVAISGDGQHLLIGAEATGGDNDLDDVWQYRFNPASGRYGLVRTYEGQFGSRNFGGVVDIDDDGDTYLIADDGADVGVDLEGYVAIWRYRPDGSIRFFANVVTPPTQSRFGQFGSAAALSGDGNTFVVADYNYSDPDLSVGRVYVYDIPENGLLTLVSSSIIGDDRFFFTGRAVDISTDGQRLAVGSSLANSNDGLARVYSPHCTTVSNREPRLHLPDLRVYGDGARLHVDYGQEIAADDVRATLFTTDGRTIASRAEPGGRGFAWAQDLPRGVYVLQLRSGGRTLARKFVW